MTDHNSNKRKNSFQPWFVLLTILGLLLVSCPAPTDTTPPSIVISNPTNNSSVPTATIQVSGVANDNVGVETLEYKLNGGTLKPIAAKAAFNFDATLKLGENTIEVFAHDAAGNPGSSKATVTYVKPKFTLAVGRTGNGAITSTQAGITCGTDCTEDYEQGLSINLTAVPDAGWRFAGWGAACTGTTTCAVNMDSAKTVTATFTAIPNFELNIVKNGTGLGSVSSDLSGLDCGSTCSKSVPEGTIVTLTATPSVGSSFASWLGACTGKDICVVTVSAAKTIIATFADVQAPTVTVTTPANNSSVTTPTIQVTGVVNDNVGVTTLEYQLNGGTRQTLPAAASFAFDVNLSLRVNTIEVFAADGAGNSSSKQVKISYAKPKVALVVSRTGNGSITSTPTGITCGTDCTEDYEQDSSLNLTAIPDSGWRFVGWGGACSGSSTCAVTMNAAKTVTAEFTTIPIFSLTMNKNGSGSGTISSSPSGIDCGLICSSSFSEGTTVNLTPTPATGSSFAGWSGACTGTSACTVTMSAAQSVTATFTDIQAPIVTIVSPADGLSVSSASLAFNGTTSDSNGVVAVKFSVNGGSRQNASGTTAWNGIATLTPGSNTIQVFATDPAGNEGSASRTITYTPPPGSLSISKTGSGSGTVTSNPAGIDCGSTCSASFASNSSINLTATASSGSTFAGWGGACTGTGACTVTMSGSQSVTATFNDTTAPTVAITNPSNNASVSSASMTVNGTASDGNGVTSVQYSINGGTRQAATGTTTWNFSTTLNAGNNTIVIFARDVAANEGTATLNLTYTPPAVSLSVSKTGSGVGTVSSNPAGINCGADCDEPYASGSSVTLTPTPAAGSSFAGWGGACSGTGVCTVVVDSAKAVSANFTDTVKPIVSITSPNNNATLTNSNLTVTGTATDNTGVTSLEYSLNGAARQTLAPGFGFTVTLVAGSNTIAVFAKDVAGNEGSSSIAVTYTPPNYALSITKTGSGTGTVSSTPAGINCGTTCVTDFVDNTSVTLTATPASGSSFVGWSGICTGTGTCTVTMNAAKSVNATFNDVAVPTVAIASPSNNTTVTSANLTVSGSSSDNIGVTTVQFSLNGGSRQNATGTEAWNFSTSLNGGSNIIVVYVKDAAGNEGNSSLNITYTPPLRTLSVTKTGTGVGGVSSTPAGIDCGATCSSDFSDGTVVTLTPIPTAGSSFVGWTGACIGTGTCTVTMNAAKSVIATFADIAAPTVTISSPANNASVTTANLTVTGSSSDNISVTGVQFSLNGGARQNATRTGTWDFSTNLSIGSNTIVVYAKDGAGNEGNSSIIVTYTPPVRTLSISKAGTGVGTVNSNPAGIDCGATCSSDFSDGTTVTLTPTPATGSSFIGWTGSCTGTGACTVSMNAAKSVTATFNDVALPTVSIASPANNSTVTNANLTVTGNSSDNLGVTGVQYSLNSGARQNASGTNPWTFNLSLTSGSNTIVVYAKDAAGNEGSAPITVTYNPPPPINSLHGKVTDPTNSNPLAGVSVVFSDGTQATTTNTTGDYSFADVPGGPLRLIISKDGFTTKYPLITIQTGDNVQDAQVPPWVTCGTGLSTGSSSTPPTDLTENNAADWCADTSDHASASLSDDTSRKQVGVSALRLVTESGFDVRMIYPKTQNARWSLTNLNQIKFWAYAENPNQTGFQNASPWIRLGSSGGYIEYHAQSEVLNGAQNTWVQVSIPVQGDSTWARTTSGTVNLNQIDWVEVHADTWDYGFNLWMDGLEFVMDQSISVTGASDFKINAPTQLTVKDAAGNPITTGITWVSSDPALASVDANGVVTGKRWGTVTISATVGGKTGTVTGKTYGMQALGGTYNHPGAPAPNVGTGYFVGFKDKTGVTPDLTGIKVKITGPAAWNGGAPYLDGAFYAYASGAHSVPAVTGTYRVDATVGSESFFTAFSIDASQQLARPEPTTSETSSIAFTVNWAAISGAINYNSYIVNQANTVYTSGWLPQVASSYRFTNVDLDPAVNQGVAVQAWSTDWQANIEQSANWPAQVNLSAGGVSFRAAPQLEARLYNVDDYGKFYSISTDGIVAERLLTNYGQDSGRVDMTQYLVEKANRVEVDFVNTSGGFTYGLQLWLNGQMILDHSCGTAGSVSCQPNDDVAFTKYLMRPVIRSDGTYTIIEMSPRNPVVYVGQTVTFSSLVSGVPADNGVSWAAYDPTRALINLGAGSSIDFTPTQAGIYQVCAHAGVSRDAIPGKDMNAVSCAFLRAIASASITGITANASTTTVTSGNSINLSATVTGTGSFDGQVFWSIPSGGDVSTLSKTVSNSGETINLGTQGGLSQDRTVTVRAASGADPSKFQDISITIQGQIRPSITNLSVQTFAGRNTARFSITTTTPNGATVMCRVLNSATGVQVGDRYNCTGTTSHDIDFPNQQQYTAEVKAEIDGAGGDSRNVTFTTGVDGGGSGGNQCPAQTIASGYALVREAKGIKLFQSGNNFVQRIELCSGASLRMFVGTPGANFSFTKLGLLDFWNIMGSNKFAAVNGQFFGGNPTQLSFGIKQDGNVITQGSALCELLPRGTSICGTYSRTGVYDGHAMLFEYSSTQAKIRSIAVSTSGFPLDQSSEPNAILSIDESARNDSTRWTMVGVSSDGKVVYLLSSANAQTPPSAGNILRAFGASQVMLLDGGGSTQLISQGSLLISSSDTPDRLIPHVLGSFGAP
jgi:Divergent InlB B-repeat domain/Carboxypeptidase regulatory-like domain/Bacterial Ig domain/Phosphodiester glycosidase/Glucodextranase, domain B/Bacterial Ig-like domain (group 2)